MKSNFTLKLRKSRLAAFRDRFTLRLVAPVIPLIPRQISYLEDLLGDG